MVHGGMGWDPLKEDLWEFVQRLRIEEQMSSENYDDRKERRLEQGKALCLWWARPKMAPAPKPVIILQLSFWPVTVHDRTEAA